MVKRAQGGTGIPPVISAKSTGERPVLRRSKTASQPSAPSQPMTSEGLARQLGLSRSTVSIVLRGEAKRRKISPQTTQRVMAAARAARYVPSQVARNLRRQRSDMIGVIFPDFSMDWAERVMSGMLEVFSPKGYSAFVATHRFDPELAEREVLSSLQRRDDGLICFPLPGENEIYGRFDGSGIPLVFIGDRPTDMPQTSSVIWDAGTAAAEAMRHLLHIGRRHIGFLGIDLPLQMSQARFAAYESALAEAKLPLNPQWVFALLPIRRCGRSLTQGSSNCSPGKCRTLIRSSC